MIDMDLGRNRTATFPHSVQNKLLVVMEDVDLGPRPDTIPTITQVTMLYCCVYLVLIVMLMIVFMKNERGDSTGDGETGGIRSQVIIHSYFQNDGENIDGVGRSEFRSQTNPSPFHYSGVICRLLYFYIYGHEKSGNKSHTSQISSYNHGLLYISHPMFP